MSSGFMCPTVVGKFSVCLISFIIVNPYKDKAMKDIAMIRGKKFEMLKLFLKIYLKNIYFSLLNTLMNPKY